MMTCPACWLGGGFALRIHLVDIKVAECFGGGIHGQCVPSLAGGNDQIVERDNTRQIGNI